MLFGHLDLLRTIPEFQCIDSYRKSAVNNTVRMFHFWGRGEKLTIVAAMFNFSEV
jgi:hypothetical protein